MKLVTLSITFLFFIDGAFTSARDILSSKGRAKSEFMALMKDVVKENGIEMNRSLKEAILSKATLSKPNLKGGAKKLRSLEEVEDDIQEEVDDAQEEEEEVEDDAQQEVEEEVQEDETDEAAYLEYYEHHASNKWKSWGSNYDDAMYMDDEIDYRLYKNTPFDVSGYSLKYHSCARLSSFVDHNDQDKEEEGNDQFFSNVVTNSYVTFRLCPTDTCGSDSWKGCSNMYGEYLLTMEEYGEAMEEYVAETLQQYCYFCKTCMFYDKYMYEGQDDNDHGCTYYDTCYTYKDVCNDYNDDAQDEGFTYSDFFQCTAVDVASDDDGDDEKGEDNEVYIGLHCNETIQLGLFADEDCTNYIGNEEYISTLTGYTIEQDMFEQENLGSSECVSCKKTDSKFYVPYMDDVDDEYDDDGHEYDILGLCEDMYEKSAKCHAHLWNASSTYESESDAENAYVTCRFISAVQAKDVDDYGFVSSGSFPSMYTDTTWEEDSDDDSIYSSATNLYNEPVSNRFDVPEYMTRNKEVTLGQALTLTVLATACAYMGVVAMCLKWSINSLPRKAMIPNPDAVSA